MRELLGVLLLSLMIWFHYRTNSKTALRNYYFPALLLKLMAGIGVGLLYTHYYAGGDTRSYFSQAILFGDVAFSNSSNLVKLFIQSKYELIPGFSYSNQPRAALVVKIVSVINVFSGSNYWISSMFFSFFSFMGVFQFASWVNSKFQYGKIAALSFFIWPSFVFWSSGILKETIAVGLIFYIIPTFFYAFEGKSVKNVLLIIVGLFLLFLIKYYFASVLIVVFVLYAISKVIRLDVKPLLYQIAIWAIMLVMGFLLAGVLHYNLRFENIFGVILENNEAFGIISSEQSLIVYNTASQPWVWVLINLPKALFAGLFMPLIPNSNLLFVFASIENWVLLGLMVRGLVHLNFKVVKEYSILLIATLTYITTLVVFLALSTPNLGTLARYKVSYIPVVLVLVLLSNQLSFSKKSKL